MPSTALDGPSAQFDALFTATQPRVLAYVIRRGLAPADAEDIVADVYVVAWRRFGEVRWDDPLPWLIGVVRNLLRNRQRMQRRSDALLERLRSEPRPGPVAVDATIAEIEDIRVVRRALGAVSEADQELLQLAAVEELSPAQIAVVLDCKAVTARVRLHRARTRLRAAIERSATGAGADAQARAARTEGNRV